MSKDTYESLANELIEQNRKLKTDNAELVEALMGCAEYLELFAAKAGCGVESSAPKSDADAYGVLSALPKYKSLIGKYTNNDLQ